VFDWSDNISTQVTIKMNQLARLLKTKRIGRPATEGPEINSDFEEGEEEAYKFQEELETLLKEFEEDEIGVNEQSEYLSLERPRVLPKQLRKQTERLNKSSRALLSGRKLYSKQRSSKHWDN
jgi:hypothetical protein